MVTDQKSGKSEQGKTIPKKACDQRAVVSNSESDQVPDGRSVDFCYHSPQ